MFYQKSCNFTWCFRLIHSGCIQESLHIKMFSWQWRLFRKRHMYTYKVTHVTLMRSFKHCNFYCSISMVFMVAAFFLKFQHRCYIAKISLGNLTYVVTHFYNGFHYDTVTSLSVHRFQMDNSLQLKNFAFKFRIKSLSSHISNGRCISIELVESVTISGMKEK